MKYFVLLYINFFLSVALIIDTKVASAQKKTVREVQQVWLGYISTTQLSKHYSWWNDVHYVPDGFFVARTGLTRHIGKVNVTAGHALLLLPISANHGELKRKEQRPWAELFFTLPITKSSNLIQRIRYEARFKQNVNDSIVTDGYNFTNRVRFLMAVRKNVNIGENKDVIPFVMVSDEVLLNFGEEVTFNTFDQNRIQVSVGLQNRNITYQVGYMNRFVQTGFSQYTMNHTLFFWVTHRLSLQKKQ